MSSSSILNCFPSFKVVFGKVLLHLLCVFIDESPRTVVLKSSKKTCYSYFLPPPLLKFSTIHSFHHLSLIILLRVLARPRGTQRTFFTDDDIQPEAIIWLWLLIQPITVIVQRSSCFFCWAENGKIRHSSCPIRLKIRSHNVNDLA